MALLAASRPTPEELSGGVRVVRAPRHPMPVGRRVDEFIAIAKRFTVDGMVDAGVVFPVQRIGGTRCPIVRWLDSVRQQVVEDSVLLGLPRRTEIFEREVGVV